MTTPSDSAGRLEQAHVGVCLEHNVVESPYRGEGHLCPESAGSAPHALTPQYAWTCSLCSTTVVVADEPSPYPAEPHRCEPAGSPRWGNSPVPPEPRRQRPRRDASRPSPAVQDGARLEDMAEFVDNPEPRCPCVLLLDVSGSMAGRRIEMLNFALSGFRDSVNNDQLAALRAEIAIVSFDHRVSVVQDFITADDFSPPRFSAGGGTRIAGAALQAFEMLDRRKREYRANGIPYYRPLVFLITDGYPEHDTHEEIAEAARRIAEQEAGRHAAFFAFGIEGADMDALAALSPSNRPPMALHEAQINGIFQWLANSVSSISTSAPGQRVRLPEQAPYLKI